MYVHCTAYNHVKNIYIYMSSIKDTHISHACLPIEYSDDDIMRGHNMVYHIL